jgi:DNA topoisomerase I
VAPARAVRASRFGDRKPGDVHLLMSQMLPNAPTTEIVDLREEARAVGLRYVSDDRPGITRHRSGRGFSYRATNGETIRDRAEIARINAIVIPPAWTEVWICPNPRGHILATGRDARNRKQYRYHPEWRALRDATKFDRMVAFSRALPTIRTRLTDDLALRGLSREKVLAAVVSIIDHTLIRVGNEEYARQNGSFGATTLQDDHAHFAHGELRLSFRGKSGKEHEASIDDPRLVRVVRRCQELPGEQLFAYLDETGAPRTIDSGDVNDYLREIAGEGITVKDFRTWGGSVLCHQLLLDAGPAGSETEAKRMVVAAIKLVAARLGNTPAVCRASYVHPSIIDAYLEGELRAGDDEEEHDDEDAGGLRPEERRLQSFLAA